MSQDFLLEIGVEDLPPHVIDPLCAQLADCLQEGLKTDRLKFKTVEVFSAPRRLVAWVQGLDETQPGRTLEVKGPAKKIAFDDQGHPTQAAKGFCQGQGLAVEEAYIKEVEGGEYLFLTLDEPDKPTSDVLQNLLPQTLDRLSPPETMRWNGSGIRFPRPIRSLLALLGTQVIPFRWADLTASNQSKGHRFGGGDSLKITDPGDYFVQMNAHGVMVKPQERQSSIEAQLTQAASGWGATCQPEPALMHQLVHSAEHPSAVPGNFDERFLSLPAEVLATTMINHQRFVPCYDEDTGAILPHFVGFCDGQPQSGERVRRGYEWVLEARLVDSEFFFVEDRKRPLAEYTKALKSVVYQKDLGSVWDKIERVRALARRLGQQLTLPEKTLDALDRAAFLCKADLVTLMVGEFPELQGVMGRIYAQLDGESASVAEALGEHYLPQGPNDPLPDSDVGSLLSLTDKLETIIGSLLIGQKPTGSKDPFGVRRAANAIVRIVLRRSLELDLFKLIRDQQALYDFIPEPHPLEAIEAFLNERFHHALKTEYGVAYDVADAVIASGDGCFVDVLRKAHSLERLRGSEGFRSLVLAFSRACNILTKQADEFVQGYDPKKFTDQAERDLWRALLKIESQVEKRLPQKDFDGILEQLIGLQAPIDQYFDEVLVMTDDAELRHNRLRFLNAVVGKFMLIGDLSKIVIEGT